MPIYDEPGLAFGILGKTRPADLTDFFCQVEY